MTKNKLKAPKHLSAESKKLWNSIVFDYALYDMTSQKILSVALEALDRCQKARTIIDAEGMTVLDKFGQAKQHPLLAIERDSRAAFLAGLKALNLDLEPLQDGPGRPPGK
ncbi:MAG: hypothetical protein IBX72_14730 [Nitrospirae bacterium]|nr:hypothetical protein [Nitrospirota bacterium]